MEKRNPNENGWLASAQPWIERMSETGDFVREHILDHHMIERANAVSPTNMLDIGCGEGRFCRILKKHNILATGIDPTEPLIEQCQLSDPDGTYINAFAENLPFDDASFDLVVFYLSLIDISDLQVAIGEAVRVLRPDGRLLIANLTSFVTSNGATGWITGKDGEMYYPLGRYLEERPDWIEWDGIRIRNWHRPLSAYMSALLNEGMTLTYFDEPEPIGGPQDRIEKYKNTPFAMLMEWKKPF